jgi:hypothetical protein
MGELIEASGDELDRLRNAVEKIESLATTAPAESPQTVETHWVRITSTSQTDGRYEGTRYDRTASGFDAAETIWVDTPNGETLAVGTYYAARLSDETGGVAIYDVMGAITATGGITVTGVGAGVNSITFVHSDSVAGGIAFSGAPPLATVTIGAVTTAAQTWTGLKTFSNGVAFASLTGVEFLYFGAVGTAGNPYFKVFDNSSNFELRIGSSVGCYVQLTSATGDSLNQKLNVIGDTASGSNDGAGFAVNGSVGMTGSPGNGWQFKGGICTTLGTFGGSITIGTTTVSGGTAGSVLYNTGAVVGNAGGVAITSGGQLAVSGGEPADSALSNGQGTFWFA